MYYGDDADTNGYSYTCSNICYCPYEYAYARAGINVYTNTNLYIDTNSAAECCAEFLL